MKNEETAMSLDLGERFQMDMAATDAPVYPFRRTMYATPRWRWARDSGSSVAVGEAQVLINAQTGDVGTSLHSKPGNRALIAFLMVFERLPARNLPNFHFVKTVAL
jgi:hypothetical protein